MTSKVKNKNRTVPRTYDKNGFKLRAGCLCFKDESEKEVGIIIILPYYLFSYESVVNFK